MDNLTDHNVKAGPLATDAWSTIDRIKGNPVGVLCNCKERELVFTGRVKLSMPLEAEVLCPWVDHGTLATVISPPTLTHEEACNLVHNPKVVKINKISEKKSKFLN